MELKDIGEFGLIDRISQGCIIRPENIIKGIGDDAAAFVTSEDKITLVTTDLLVERVHFLRDAVGPEILGHKSLAVNLSDIAAMGGVAREAFFSLAIPDDCSIEFIEAFYTGAKALAAKYQVNILGGDTTRSMADLIINITVAGEVDREDMLLRNGAKPEDVIACTGFPGESKAGLHMILNNQQPDTNESRRLFNAHVRPEPHLLEGRFLSKSSSVHACIDVSDGLTSDLWHMLEQSGAGATLYEHKIPISKELKAFCENNNLNPIETALSGGEDYLLLCAISKKNIEKMAAEFEKTFERPLYIIGQITDSKRMKLATADGYERELTVSGWDHFKK